MGIRFRTPKIIVMRFRSASLPALLASLALPALAREKTGAEVCEAVCGECHGSGKLDAAR